MVLLPRIGSGNERWWRERVKGWLAKREMVGVLFYLGWLKEREREEQRVGSLVLSLLTVVK